LRKQLNKAEAGAAASTAGYKNITKEELKRHISGIMDALSDEGSAAKKPRGA
jgi:hypothetical protein